MSNYPTTRLFVIESIWKGRRTRTFWALSPILSLYFLPFVFHGFQNNPFAKWLLKNTLSTNPLAWLPFLLSIHFSTTSHFMHEQHSRIPRINLRLRVHLAWSVVVLGKRICCCRSVKESVWATAFVLSSKRCMRRAVTTRNFSWIDMELSYYYWELMRCKEITEMQWCRTFVNQSPTLFTYRIFWKFPRCKHTHFIDNYLRAAVEEIGESSKIGSITCAEMAATISDIVFDEEREVRMF